MLASVKSKDWRLQATMVLTPLITLFMIISLATPWWVISWSTSEGGSRTYTLKYLSSTYEGAGRSTARASLAFGVLSVLAQLAACAAAANLIFFKIPVPLGLRRSALAAAGTAFFLGFIAVFAFCGFPNFSDGNAPKRGPGAGWVMGLVSLIMMGANGIIVYGYTGEGPGETAYVHSSYGTLPGNEQ
jgi:hypothetical protein